MAASPRSAPASARRLLDLTAWFRACRVVVLGDLIADEFVYGRVARVSREAPVLILEYDATRILPGGAGNAASNVAALGGQVDLVALAGRDEPGRRLLSALPAKVGRRGLVRPAGYKTPVKTRILAGGVHSAKQQVVRIDRHTSEVVTERHRAAIVRAAVRAARQADALLVSDYGSGLIDPRMVAEIARPLREDGIPVLVDSRYKLLEFSRLTACTPNESEVEQVLGVSIGDRPRVLERAGRAVLKKTGMDAVLMTRGSRGMALFEPNRPTLHIPIFGPDEVTDVTGAGDTVMAVMTLALGAGGTFAEAARLANYAGGLVVMKRGTATISIRELREAIRRDLAGAGDR